MGVLVPFQLLTPRINGAVQQERLAVAQTDRAVHQVGTALA